MSFADRCVHCKHVSCDIPCCFCKKYVYRSGNVVFTADKPIVVTDVTPIADTDYS